MSQTFRSQYWTPWKVCILREDYSRVLTRVNGDVILSSKGKIMVTENENIKMQAVAARWAATAWRAATAWFSERLDGWDKPAQ